MTKQWALGTDKNTENFVCPAEIGTGCPSDPHADCDEGSVACAHPAMDTACIDQKLIE